MGITKIHLSKDIEISLEQLARKLDRSRNYLINQAIYEFVLRQSMEELRWSATVEALESVKAARMVELKEVAETDRSLSDLVNEAVKLSLLEDAEDLASFEERVDEPSLAFQDVVKDLRRSGST